MAASPGQSTPDTLKKQREIDYVNKLRGIPINELLRILKVEIAEDISNSADNNGPVHGMLDDENQDIKYNTAFYDDGAEDYIENSSTLRLINESRIKGDHYSAEKVRILRSARTVMYYTYLGENNGI